MLKTNSKKAIQNIKNYIMDNFDASNYSEYKNVNNKNFKEVATVINKVFQTEKYYSAEYEKAHHLRELDTFRDWAQGLPSVLNTCYYYNRFAVDDLAIILEETDSKKSEYSESAAAELLTFLIYRTIKAEAEK